MFFYDFLKFLESEADAVEAFANGLKAEAAAAKCKDEAKKAEEK